MMMTKSNSNNGNNRNAKSARRSAEAQNGLLMELGRSLVTAHVDLGTTLEVAQKYEEAGAEYGKDKRVER